MIYRKIQSKRVGEQDLYSLKRETRCTSNHIETYLIRNTGDDFRQWDSLGSTMIALSRTLHGSPAMRDGNEKEECLEVELLLITNYEWVMIIDMGMLSHS